MKKCKICLEYKDFDEFYKKKDSKDGLQPKCISCHKKIIHNHYLANKEAYKERVRQHRIYVIKEKRQNGDEQDKPNELLNQEISLDGKTAMHN